MKQTNSEINGKELDLESNPDETRQQAVWPPVPNDLVKIGKIA